MGLLTGILRLPTLPQRGALAAIEKVVDVAEEEFYDPAKIRAKLEEVDRLRHEGVLSDEEATAYEDELVERLLEGQARQRRKD